MKPIIRVSQRPQPRNKSSSISSSSGRSHRSQSTSQTAYSQYPMLMSLGKDSSRDGTNGRESTDTYASTIVSEEEEDETYEPPIEVVEERYEDFPSDAIPSSPPSFGELFPSTRRLLIKHDDTTVDGNLNLRIDTIANQPNGEQCVVILFHLRMHDLRSRKFSLRRYCRDSGREVCHSTRKYRYPAAERIPGLQRPLSNAFSSLRSKSDSLNLTTSASWKQDPGCKSGTECNEKFEERRGSVDSLRGLKAPQPTNVIQLEFSNYAHVDVKPGGSKGSKHYDFEYWSKKYQWKRTSRKDGDSKETSYHLIRGSKPKPVAHIYPEPLTPLEDLDEKSKGGWVPPCSMWISDPSLFETMKDVADVIVATGLIALVDDSIKRRWHSKRAARSHSPMTSSFMKSMDSVASNKIIEKVFHRRGSTESRHTSLRQMFAHP
ncbi:hypothetical protein AJ79_03556 [Helicocarpus griseus UAMH5409]|uniref:Uncharacterized protein n=1 Tax=Helicocarpus griseus UAMH5409 TaxID=1447875 RepID=A0A2B7XXQ0_9EURO|nr:hypothetical protein AJ79_03556 [Helicocarpus griseus UAMH5409]